MSLIDSSLTARTRTKQKLETGSDYDTRQLNDLSKQCLRNHVWTHWTLGQLASISVSCNHSTILHSYISRCLFVFIWRLFGCSLCCRHQKKERRASIRGHGLVGGPIEGGEPKRIKRKRRKGEGKTERVGEKDERKDGDQTGYNSQYQRGRERTIPTKRTEGLCSCLPFRKRAKACRCWFPCFLLDCLVSALGANANGDFPFWKAPITHPGDKPSGS